MNPTQNNKGITMKKRLYLASIMLTAGIAGLLLTQRTLRAETIAPATTENEAKVANTAAINAGELLTIAKVVAITRQNQPAILAARGNVNASQSRVGQAKAPYYPQVNGGGSYDRLSPGGTMYGITDNSTYNRLAVGLDASQMIYDFGKTTTKVEIQKTSLDSARADLNAADDSAVFNAKLAYYNILKIARNIEVATETVKQFEQHLTQAKGFFEAGTKPKYDVTKAEVDLSHAKLVQIQVDNSLRLARVVLNNAMGLPNAPDYKLEDTLTSAKFTLPYEQALPMALDHRPDLKAMVLKKQAALQSIDLARKGDAPYLSGNASTAYTGDVDTNGQGWSAGVSVTVPIFNGHLTRHQIDEAQANADIMAANVTTLEQSIHKDVEQSYLNLQEAEERIATTKLAIQQAQENSTIASGRYSAGVGSPVEVTDADILLVQAKADHNQALYDYRIAQTSIEQAIGVAADNGPATKTE
ncbi:MAG: TolC family protein [Deltaproteobacteria bacterium]|nr:TolC family protein [Deltaproteobacteria bacterium]